MKRKDTRIGIKVTNANEFESTNGLAISKNPSRAFSYGIVLDDRLAKKGTVYRALVAFWKNLPGNTAISVDYFPLCRLKVVDEFPNSMPDTVRDQLAELLVERSNS